MIYWYIHDIYTLTFPAIFHGATGRIAGRPNRRNMLLGRKGTLSVKLRKGGRGMRKSLSLRATRKHTYLSPGVTGTCWYIKNVAAKLKNIDSYQLTPP